MLNITVPCTGLRVTDHRSTLANKKVTINIVRENPEKCMSAMFSLQAKA